MPFLKALLALFLAILSAFNLFRGPNEVPSVKNNFDFTYLEYPAEAVLNLKDVGLSVEAYTGRADVKDDGYVAAQGYTDVNGIIESPYHKVHINSTRIPVYSTTVFVGQTQTGELHSFSEIYIEKGKKFSLAFQLNPTGFYIDDVIVLPESLNLKLEYGRAVTHATITDFGTYTFVFNNGGQEYAYTLFVKEDIDEEKEIAELQGEYGEANVYVYDKGVYRWDYASSIGAQNSVYYLKRGAYFIANHKYDINSDADNNNYVEDGALSESGIGLTRYPFLNFNSCSNIKLLGNGVFDFSNLDWHERRGLVFTSSNNIEVRGIKLINPAEWSFITYRCNNFTIKDVDVFGYRQNGDAFAICNSQNVTVDNCFARAGDDLFDVKTLGGDSSAISDNVTFTNCIAWNGKARCFGICGEVNLPISNITFKDCAVIHHDATWDADRIPALAIIAEQGGGSISGITFENIEIYRAHSRAIGCLVYESGVSNMIISDIKYKNISYSSALPNKVAGKSSTNSVSAEFENIYSSGFKINEVNSSFFEYDDYATITLK